MNILYIYKWATMGGVERVILNRVHSLKDQKSNIKTSVYFLEDYGGIKKMTEYINYYNLNEQVEIVRELNPGKYNFIISIDTPEIFDELKDYPLIVECHSILASTRQYLKSLPDNIIKIIFPSAFFYDDVTLDIPQHKDKFFVLPNFVPTPEIREEIPKNIYSKIPIVYTGRLDHQKNALEIIEIVSKARESCGDRFIVIYAGSILFPIENLQHYIEQMQMNGRVIFIPHVSFHKMNNLLYLVKNHKGIFMSASTGETFGMSVAEAMSFDIPVLISNIKAHSTLVSNDSDFLFPLNDIKKGAKKLVKLVDSWDAKSKKIKSYKKAFEQSKFIKVWDELINELQLVKKNIQ